MTKGRLRWTRRALRRLDSIGAFIAKENPRAASSVVARILSCAEHLRTYPVLGRGGRVDGTRELVVPRLPYIVVYRCSGDDVDILTILHGTQQWPPFDGDL